LTVPNAFPPAPTPEPPAEKPPRDPLDRKLPPEMRGREGFAAFVAGIKVRASVAGTCGTFALTRAAHAALRGRRLRAVAKVATVPAAASRRGLLQREIRRRTFDEALVADLKRAYPVEGLVAASGDTGRKLRDFNHMVQATHVLVPGVARDPVDGSLRPDKARAAAFAASVPPGAVLVSGERDRLMRKVLRDGAERGGARFIDAAPRDEAGMPGLEVHTVLDAFLRSAGGVGLSAAERVQAMARLQRRLRWRPSALPGLRWLDANALPNAPSLRAALDHLGQVEPARAHAVVYVHSDQQRDAAWLGPVLRQALEDGALAHVSLIGAGATVLAEELRHLPSTLFLDRRATVDSVVRTLAREPNGAVVTLGAAASPWSRMLQARLRRDDLEAGAWAPPAESVGPDAKEETPIAQAAVLRAPSMGRRPVVNILGDLDRELGHPAGPVRDPGVQPAAGPARDHGAALLQAPMAAG
jgi:hypothetical protein